LLTIDHIHELARYRRLIAKLAWSDFKLRYRGSVLGFVWSLLEPLLMLLVLYVVFTNLMRVQVEYYQLFLLIGIILWNLLDRGTGMGLNAIVGKPSLVQKVYFPRDILVISSTTTALLMTLLEMVVFFVFMAVFRVKPTSTILYFPIIFFLEMVIVQGLSLALSALNVYFRDVQFIWRVIIQAGFFATPILYPVTIFPENLQKIVMLNPMAMVITMSRNAILYDLAPTPADLAYTALSALIILLIGYLVFDRREPGFVEAI
jgi:lipopolysaccharide transport system permease protein